MDNTFVTVTWNNQNQIEGLIQSIQKYEPESLIVVVDNNSNDETVKRAEKYKNVKVIKLDKNVGFSAANNKAMIYVETKYVTFINPDTRLLSRISSKLSKDLTNSKVDLIGVKLQNSNGTLQPSIFKFQTPFEIIIEQFGLGKFLPEVLKRKWSPENSRHNQKILVDWLVGAFYFTETKSFVDVGGFSEEYFLYAEDMDFCYKYKLQGKRVLFDPSISIEHIGGTSEEKTSSSKNLKLLKSFSIFAKKYNLTKNILTLYICYKIKRNIFFFVDKKRANKYRDNVNYLKGQL
ncbi:glycosyltransferase [Limosilactobacillus reuteri]|uniref:glycosyltransferase n=1 Tax=Limosilactobacillus reuteri TaxID=1598 RepID=UPI001E45AD0C|nr:glycosyltransferase [Limosilactobacillus reuteri]MCC4410165.1 glycosyltransferase [Limosilactobacillus reuteri]